MKSTQLWFLSCCLFFTSGCQSSYYIKSAWNQIKLLDKRVPIEVILKDPEVSDHVKHKLRLAQEAREFAEKTLKLKPTNNYTSYVDLKRPYVSWVVQAASAYELKHHYFKFPIVGKLPYKGFFSKEEAQQEAAKFPPKKFDTYVRGVTAYSTLGWFKDPLLSTMVGYKDPDFVNLIIHETVHATIYIKGQADFNERLATFIGNRGTELFYLYKEGESSPTLKGIEAEYADRKLFSDFISWELDKLKKWYSDNYNKTAPEMKKNRLDKITQRFEKKILNKMKTKKFTGFTKQNLNNARLLSYRTYVYDLEDFERAFKSFDKNFDRFLKFCKSLEKAEKPEAELKKITAK